MSNIMVTGGSGFIGSHFILNTCLRYPQSNIINVDAKTYAARPPMWSAKPSNLEEVMVDIRDQAMVARLMDMYQPEKVFHFAAESHVCRSIKGPKDFVTTNVNGTFNLLEEYRQVKGGKFIHISTDEVFGDWEPGQAPFTETSPLLPRSPYAASKAAAEMLVQCWGTTYGMAYTLVNMTNVFGPNQHTEKLIPMTISKILKGEEVVVHGDGTHSREWLYVESAVEGILKAAEHESRDRFLLGSGVRYKNIDMVRTLHLLVASNLMEMKLPLNIKFTNDRPTDDKGYAVDSRYTEARLNWSGGRDTFSENLGKTVHWYIHDILRRGGRTAHGRAG